MAATNNRKKTTAIPKVGANEMGKLPPQAPELEESVLKESYFVIEKELTKEEYPELKQNIPMYYVLHFTYEVDKENENKIQNAKLMNDYYFQSKEKSNKIIIKETTGLSVTLDGYKINFNHSLKFEDINIPISVNFTIDTYQ